MAYTTIDDPSAHFQTLLHNSSSNTAASYTFDGNSEMQPDVVWHKNRDYTDNNYMFDSSRGADQALYTNSTAAEVNHNSSLTSFDSNGYSVGTSNVTSGAGTYVSWCWKANGGTTSSNTDGTITSTVQANTDAGFSIVTFTSPSSGSFSMGHGLGVKPDMVITKSLNGTSNWWTWHKGLTNDTTYYLDLSATSAEGSISSMWGSTGFTSSVFGMNYPNSAFANRNYIAYCFAGKQGYSKFGKYTGNGDTNGTFVYTGFKPAFVMFKESSAADNWVIIDSKRDTYNAADATLYADLSNAEENPATSVTGVDLLSNGFKFRDSKGFWNTSGSTYIYMAFAENPFVTSTGIPTTAR